MAIKLKKYFRRKFRRTLSFFSKTKENSVLTEYFELYSVFLQRKVKLILFLPPQFNPTSSKRYPLVIFNDGQDMERLKMQERLTHLYQRNRIAPLLILGIYADENRMQEYGTASQPDYGQRGTKAAAYTRFVIEELLPYLHDSFPCKEKAKYQTIAGFSLGGLSAFDIAWHHPEHFQKVGVFSGSLWWRSEPFDEANPDANRIMHEIVAKSKKRKGMQFWFQAGTKDEEGDRNNNGIIDAIDDTMDLMAALKKLGYKNRDIEYLEVKDGEHNPTTWGAVMPEFLDFID